MNRSALQYDIWKNLGYLNGNISPEYQRHLWKLSDQEIYDLWLNIHNAREAYYANTIE